MRKAKHVLCTNSNSVCTSVYNVLSKVVKKPATISVRKLTLKEKLKYKCAADATGYAGEVWAASGAAGGVGVGVGVASVSVAATAVGVPMFVSSTEAKTSVTP